MRIRSCKALQAAISGHYGAMPRFRRLRITCSCSKEKAWAASDCSVSVLVTDQSSPRKLANMGAILQWHHHTTLQLAIISAFSLRDVEAKRSEQLFCYEDVTSVRSAR